MTRAIFLTVFLLAAICFLDANNSAQSSEPMYNGRALSECLLELRFKPTFSQMSKEANKQFLEPSDVEQLYNKKRQRDEAAIREIGTNAIPTLLEILSVTSKNVKKVVSNLQNQQLQQEYSVQGANLEDLRGLAVDGFGVLGTNAEAAIPKLEQLFHNPETRLQAIRALTKVGPRGFSVVTNALADKDPTVRNNLIWVIGEDGGGDSKAITQLLITSLKDSDPSNRGNAADFLAGKDPALAIPALIGVLDDKEYYPRSRAAIALGGFGIAAKSAVPKLLSVYRDVLAGQDKQLIEDLGSSLIDAVKRIDPEAAAKVGSR